VTTIHRIEVPIPYPVNWTNCYYIEDSVPTLIDTGVNLPEAFDAIASGIRKHHGRVRDIRRIIVTHGHIDHVGLAGRIADASAAEVFVHQWETVRAYSPGGPLEEKAEDFRRFFVEAGVPDDTIPQLIEYVITRNKTLCSPLSLESPLNAVSSFTFDDFNLRVIHTAGHSPGSVCLFDETHGDLFSGDTLFPEVISDPTIESGAEGRLPGFVSITSHHASLDLIESLPVNRVLPGHGAPFRDHEKRVRKIRNHQHRRSRQIFKIMQDRGQDMNQFMVARELYSELNGWDIFYGVSTARGHLNLLHEQGSVARWKHGGQYLYRFQD